MLAIAEISEKEQQCSLAVLHANEGGLLAMLGKEVICKLYEIFLVHGDIEL